MSHRLTALPYRHGTVALAVVVFIGLPAAARAQSDAPGRVEFDFAGGPPATVELDFGQGMLADIAGIEMAAISGVAEALFESPDAPVKKSAEQLVAVREIIKTLSTVVSELRVRVYEDLPDAADGADDTMAAHYTQKLVSSDWDHMVRVRDGDDRVSVSAKRNDGAIRGLFVVAGDGGDLVLVNVVCNLAPEKVQDVANRATKIAMEFGLEKEITKALKHLKQHSH